MTRDEIIAMAKEAGFTTATAQYPYEVLPIASPEQLERFFHLAYAAGQRDMQERAAEAFGGAKSGMTHVSKKIRNLEVK